MSSKKKYSCPCCGCYTLDNKPPGTFDICPVCYWEDDNIQFLNPELEGGANEVSLIEVRKNYKRFGAISKDYIELVRTPLDDEKYE